MISGGYATMMARGSACYARRSILVINGCFGVPAKNSKHGQLPQACFFFSLHCVQIHKVPWKGARVVFPRSSFPCSRRIPFGTFWTSFMELLFRECRWLVFPGIPLP